MTSRLGSDSEGTRIFVQAGVYREVGNPTNGLNITKNGIRLIGQTTPNKRVILENAGNQRNGIVVVPPAEEDCMSCHDHGDGFAGSGCSGCHVSAQPSSDPTRTEFATEPEESAAPRAPRHRDD